MVAFSARCFSSDRFLAAHDVAMRICCNFLLDLCLAIHPLGHFSYAPIDAATVTPLTIRGDDLDVILKTVSVPTHLHFFSL